MGDDEHHSASHHEHILRKCNMTLAVIPPLDLVQSLAALEPEKSRNRDKKSSSSALGFEPTLKGSLRSQVQRVIHSATI